MFLKAERIFIYYLFYLSGIACKQRTQQNFGKVRERYQFDNFIIQDSNLWAFPHINYKFKDIQTNAFMWD
jgi:hypothetical protein